MSSSERCSKIPRLLTESYLRDARTLGFPVADAKEHPSGSARWWLECEGGTIIFSRSGKAQVRFVPEVEAASKILLERVRREGWTPGLLFPIAGSYAQRLGRGAILVAQPKLGGAFVVQEFFVEYVSSLFPETDLRPLCELLGPPSADATRAPSGEWEQQFANGRLSRDPGGAVQLTLW
jgi:hypothetical protein